jgi:hypothetical protein
MSDIRGRISTEIGVGNLVGWVGWLGCSVGWFCGILVRIVGK